MRAFVVAALLGSVAAYSSLRAQNLGAPAPAAAGAPGAPGAPAEPEIQYENKEFEKDWHNEWKHGDFPSYKKTYSENTFPGRKAVVAAEDTQSDGMPGTAGLSGANVGAYLKHNKDGTIDR